MFISHNCQWSQLSHQYQNWLWFQEVEITDPISQHFTTLPELKDLDCMLSSC